MKASKFLNIFIPVIAGTSIAAVPAGIYIGNQGIFHFQVKVSSLDDCATLNNTGATIGRDYVTSISLKEGYTVESFDILVGGERLPGYAYAYAPNPQKLIIYGKYITSQDVSITVNTTSQPAGRSFETDSWSNVIRYCNGSFEDMQHFYGRSSFIGLERTVDVTIGTKRSYKVRVVGQQEDYNAETGKQVALTFEFENTLTNTNGISLKFKYSDSSSVSSSRWGESKVREEINHLSSAMDQTVAQAAKIVQKQTYNGISSSIKPSLTRDKFFLPSLFEYFSMKGLTSGLVYEGIKHFIEYGGGKIESPQYSYYRQKVGDQSPNDLYEQFYRYPIVDEQGVIPLPNSYWLRSAVNDSTGAVANGEVNTNKIVIGQTKFNIYPCTMQEFAVCPMFCI